MSRMSMRLCVLLLAANGSADPLAAATPVPPGPGGGYSSFAGGQKLYFRRPGPKGKG